METIREKFFDEPSGDWFQNWVQSYPRDDWVILDTCGIPDSGDPEIRCFNTELIRIAIECDGQSRQLFKLEYERLLGLWWWFEQAEEKSFAVFLADIPNAQDVFNPTNDFLNQIDEARYAKGYRSYLSESARFVAFCNECATNEHDYLEPYEIREDLSFCWTQYVYFVGFIEASFDNWKCLSSMIGTMHQTGIKKANREIHQLVADLIACRSVASLRASETSGTQFS